MSWLFSKKTPLYKESWKSRQELSKGFFDYLSESVRRGLFLSGCDRNILQLMRKQFSPDLVLSNLHN